MEDKFKELFNSLPDFIKQGHEEAIAELMSLASKNKFKVGDQVVLHKDGGVISAIDNDAAYPISVEFKKDGTREARMFFTIDGKLLNTDQGPSLFLAEEYENLIKTSHE